MNKIEKLAVSLSFVFAAVFSVTGASFGMHIMEGFLPGRWCIFWGALSLPFIVIGIIKIGKLTAKNRKILLLLAMVGAFVFVVSALKIPSLTGSSSHPTGVGLGAVIFGPFAMVVIGLISLLFQAILIAHGGITTLGANVFSMAIVGPFVSFGIYMICKKIKVNKLFSVFLAVWLGDLCTYCVTAFQLALAHPSGTGGVFGSLVEFMMIFSVTQIPISVIDGIVATIVIIGLESYANPELKALGYFGKGTEEVKA